MEVADTLIGLYGLHEFLSDIDQGRLFRDEAGLVADVFEWLSGPGFGPYFRQFGEFRWNSALEFKQRFLIGAMTGMRPMR